MRGSDVIDLMLDWLPRRWVQVGLFVLIAVMALTHWTAPFTWYVMDRAQGIEEQITPILSNMVTQIATIAPAPVTP